MVSCGDDAVADGCTECKLSVPLLADCEVTVCQDGTSTSNDATTCVVADLLAAGGTQTELVMSLEDAGFDCSN